MIDIEDHLRSCTECSNELATIRSLQKTFNADSTPEIPSHISFEITESIYNNKFGSTRSAGAGLLSSWIKRSAAYIVVGLIAGSAGFLMSYHLWFTPEPQVNRSLDSVEMMFTMTPFSGNSDGSLFQLYTDYTVSYEERDLK
jgi:hypothetical protein